MFLFAISCIIELLSLSLPLRRTFVSNFSRLFRGSIIKLSSNAQGGAEVLFSFVPKITCILVTLLTIFFSLIRHHTRTAAANTLKIRR
jgi:hypothetical protein